MKKLIKDPLLHFLLIGALLFLVFEFIKSPEVIQENNIVITRGDIDSLQANFTRTWQRPPTEDELSGLINDKVQSEIAFREAVNGFPKGNFALHLIINEPREFIFRGRPLPGTGKIGLQRINISTGDNNIVFLDYLRTLDKFKDQEKQCTNEQKMQQRILYKFFHM